MAAELPPWVPNEEELRAIRAAILKERPNLAGNEAALLLAEERVVSWVIKQESESSGQ